MSNRTWWKQSSIDKCPRCGNTIEALTESTDPDQYLYDGDEVRCVECHAPGSFSTDGDESAYVNWQEDDYENGTTDYCKWIRENKRLQAELKIARQFVDAVALGDFGDSGFEDNLGAYARSVGQAMDLEREDETNER